MLTFKCSFPQILPSVIVICIALVGAGCKSQSPETTAAIPTMGSSPTLISTQRVTAQPVIDQPEIREEVIFDLGNQSNGLYLDTGGDVDYEIVKAGEHQVIRSGNGRVLPSPDGNTVQDSYVQFNVDDNFIFEADPNSRVRIEIEYLDDGTDNFSIEYDALSGGLYDNGTFKASNVITKSGTGSFKTAVLLIDDAFFGNRDNGADFRISDHSDGYESIRRVNVSLLFGKTDVVQPPSEAVRSTPEPLPDNQANIVFWNGVILTMEDGFVTTAIAIKDDRILDVGTDEAMLAYAGPGTELIDLTGRTLMPGFVDAHSHVLNGAYRHNFEAGQDFVLAHGITTSAELYADAEFIHEISTLDREGRLRLRVSLYPAHNDFCGNILGPWYREDFPVIREAGAKLQIPGVKIYADGGGCNLPATSFDSDGNLGGEGSGDLYFSAGELTEIIREVQSYGYQVAIHGLGDRAIEVNLDAIEAALAGEPNTYRHRIEHNTLLRDDLLLRYGEIGVVPTIFATFPTCFFTTDSGEFRGRTPEEFLYWEWRWRDLIDTNPDLHIAWKSDALSDVWPINPMISLHRFVTRKEMHDDGIFCEPPEWAADDLLTVEEALPMMTYESAYALLREDEVGSLKAGKLADLIILSANPLEVDPDAILDNQVLMTMVGGVVEYCSDEGGAFCP